MAKTDCDRLREYQDLEDENQDLLEQVSALEKEKDLMFDVLRQFVSKCPDCGKFPELEKIAGIWHVGCGNEACGRTTDALDVNLKDAIGKWNEAVGQVFPKFSGTITADMVGQTREGFLWRIPVDAKDELEKDLDDGIRYDHGVHHIACHDAIRDALGEEQYRGWCKGDAIAYIWREGYKGKDDDLKKAISLLEFAVEASEEDKDLV